MSNNDKFSNPIFLINKQLKALNEKVRIFEVEIKSLKKENYQSLFLASVNLTLDKIERELLQ